jgi:hypothetical protein
MVSTDGRVLIFDSKDHAGDGETEIRKLLVSVLENVDIEKNRNRERHEEDPTGWQELPPLEEWIEKVENMPKGGLSLTMATITLAIIAENVWSVWAAKKKYSVSIPRKTKAECLQIRMTQLGMDRSENAAGELLELLDQRIKPKVRAIYVHKDDQGNPLWAKVWVVRSQQTGSILNEGKIILGSLCVPAAAWKPVRACYKCGSVAHIAKDCGGDKLCRKCGSSEHLAEDCKANTETLCKYCHQEGHEKRTCEKRKEDMKTQREGEAKRQNINIDRGGKGWSDVVKENEKNENKIDMKEMVKEMMGDMKKKLMDEMKKEMMEEIKELKEEMMKGMVTAMQGMMKELMGEMRKEMKEVMNEMGNFAKKDLQNDMKETEMDDGNETQPTQTNPKTPIKPQSLKKRGASPLEEGKKPRAKGR